MIKLIDKFTAPTPAVWKVVGRILTAIAALSGSILAIPGLLPGDPATRIVWFIFTASSFLAIFAGKSTITPKVASNMKKEALLTISKRLSSKPLTEIQSEVLNVVNKELTKRL